ncbi:MAG TPA: hypothetical protein VGE45_00500 [Chloroflexia bacterium]|jgi:hypothetical protein
METIKQDPAEKDVLEKAQEAAAAVDPSGLMGLLGFGGGISRFRFGTYSRRKYKENRKRRERERAKAARYTKQQQRRRAKR